MTSLNEGDNQALTAIKIFRRFIVQKPDGSLDASGVNSPECYQMWLASRKKLGKNPEVVFQRTLTGHLGAVDGRHPFNPEEEAAVLKHLRIRQRWPCFKDSSIRFGELGYRALGYHERLAHEATKNKPDLNSKLKKQPQTMKKKRKGRRQKQQQQRGRSESEESSNSHSSLASNTSSASCISIKKKVRLIEEEQDKEMMKSSSSSFSQKSSSSSTTTTTTKISRARIGEELVSTSTGTATNSSNSSSASFWDHSEPVADVTSTLEHDLAYLAHLRSVGAPPPPPPQPSSWHAMNIHYLLTSAWSIVSHISDPRMWWSYILGFVRYRLITRGWYVGPTMEDARRKMEEWQRKFPNEAINVYDFTAVDYTQRIMLQNELSVAWFGGISRAYGGFTGKRFQPKDGWKLFKAIAQAFTYKDTEQQLHLQWILADGTSTAYFDSVFMCCESSRLVMERKKLSPWQYDF